MADRQTDRNADREIARRVALAWRELRRGAASTALRSQLLGAEGPTLEQAQLDALETLVTHPGGRRMSDLADALRVEPSTATRAVARLEALGLATRRNAEHDRRIVIATATPTGVRTIRRIAKLRAVALERLLEEFDDDERRQFAEHLERFVAAIDRLVAEITPEY